MALAAMDSEPVAWLAIYHGEVYDDAIGITRSVVEAQADRFGWESALTEIIPLYRHAPPAPEKYNIGDTTMRHIFTPTGMTNVSNMQAVFDRVEAVLVGMEQPAPVVPEGLNIRAVAALREAVRNQWLKSDELADMIYWKSMHDIANEIIGAMLAAAPQEVK